MNIVESLFAEKATFKAGGMYFSKQDTLEFIEECRKFRIGILGIDGIFITETTTQPSMADSINYSDGPSCRYDYDKALAFIAERDDRLLFEIVCEELKEPPNK